MPAILCMVSDYGNNRIAMESHVGVRVGWGAFTLHNSVAVIAVSAFRNLAV